MILNPWVPQAKIIIYLKHQNADAEQFGAILAAATINAVDRERLSVGAAHRRTGIAAADFSRIRNADLVPFTVDRLMSILKRLGSRVEEKPGAPNCTARGGRVVRRRQTFPGIEPRLAEVEIRGTVANGAAPHISMARRRSSPPRHTATYWAGAAVMQTIRLQSSTAWLPWRSNECYRWHPSIRSATSRISPMIPSHVWFR